MKNHPPPKECSSSKNFLEPENQMEQWAATKKKETKKGEAIGVKDRRIADVKGDEQHSNTKKKVCKEVKKAGWWYGVGGIPLSGNLGEAGNDKLFETQKHG